MMDFIREFAIPLIIGALVIGYGLGFITTGPLFSIREGSEE
jgi:hypothetical protein